MVFAKKEIFLMSQKGILDNHWRDTPFLMCKYEQIFTFWLCLSVWCNGTPKNLHNSITNEIYSFDLIKPTNKQTNKSKMFIASVVAEVKKCPSAARNLNESSERLKFPLCTNWKSNVR